MKISKPLVYLISFFVVVLWGMSYIWNNALLALGIPVEYFIFVRVLTGSLMLLFLNLVTGVSIKIRKKDIHKFLLLALFEPFVYFLCETYGILMTESPTYSAMIVATTPLFSIISARVFFNEKLTTTNIIGFIVCVAGIIIVSISPSSIGKYFILGVFLLIIAAICEVGQASVTKWLASDYKPQVITMYQFFIGSIYLLPLFLTKGMHNFEPQLYLSWSVWSPILSLALFCSVLCFTLWVYSIEDLGVAKACIILAMVPIVTALVSTLIGTDNLKQYQWLGIIVACTGVILSQVSPAKIPSSVHGKHSESSNGK